MSSAHHQHDRELAERTGRRGLKTEINRITVGDSLSCVLCSPLFVSKRNRPASEWDSGD